MVFQLDRYMFKILSSSSEPLRKKLKYIGQGKNRTKTTLKEGNHLNTKDEVIEELMNKACRTYGK